MNFENILKKFPLSLKSSGKHVILLSISLYCTWKNICAKNNKFNISAPTWNVKLELFAELCFVSDVNIILRI